MQSGLYCYNPLYKKFTVAVLLPAATGTAATTKSATTTRRR